MAVDGTSILKGMAEGVMARKDQATKNGPPTALTPVAGETGRTGPLTVPGAPFPWDGDAERMVAGAIEEIRRQMAFVETGLVAIEAAIGRDGRPEPVDPKLEAKLAAKEAERRGDDVAKAQAGDKRAEERVRKIADAAPEPEAFEARMKRLQAEAEAATYKDGQVEDPPEPKTVTAARDAAAAGGGPAEVMAAAMAAEQGWVCPTHGPTTVVLKTSRKNRQFRACGEAGCEEFERLT